MIKLYYDKVKQDVVAHQFDEGDDDHSSDTNLVEVPKSLAGLMSRQELCLYMATYVPGEVEEEPVRLSEEELEGSKINDLLAAFFKDEEWRAEGGVSTQTTQEQIDSFDIAIGNLDWRLGVNIPPDIFSQFLNVYPNIDLPITLGDLVDSEDETITYSVTGSSDISAIATNTLVFNAATAGVQSLIVTATDIRGGTDIATITVTVVEPPVLDQPVLSDATILTLIDTDREHTLGPTHNGNGELITYSLSPADYPIVGNVVTINSGTAGVTMYSVIANDGDGADVTADLSVTIVADFSFIMNSNEVLTPDFGSGIIAKGETVMDLSTGVSVTRITDSLTDMQQSNQAVNGYSRWTQENSDGTMVIAFGTNSTSCTVLNTQTYEIVAYLAMDDSGLETKTIGMAHEVRWDTSGNNPNRVYFRNGAVFYAIDDVTQNENITRSNPTRRIVKDFEPLVNWPSSADGTSKRIYNDQESTSSNDGDHWVWMAAFYDGSNYQVAAFVHYQISTDTIDYLYPSSLAGTNMDSWSNDQVFPTRPNMVDMSPLGTGILFLTGRAYAGGSREAQMGTYFDGPHLWPLDFNVSPETGTEPFRVAMDEAHGGWAWAGDGRELYVFQDNRRDYLCATYISGANKGFSLDSTAGPNDSPDSGSIDFAYHSELSWTGFHFARMAQSKPGYVMVSTYSSGSGWANDQLLMFEIKDKDDNPDLWRVAPMRHKYSGSYWDEATASMNQDGTAIYVGNNWGQVGGNSNELYRYNLPDSWHDKLMAPTYFPPIYGIDITVTDIEVL